MVVLKCIAQISFVAISIAIQLFRRESLSIIISKLVGAKYWLYTWSLALSPCSPFSDIVLESSLP